ncbi:MAG: hypothetical protein A2176_10295 [Spirochaetes bacterium RBG_13_51_14]|nr:MAG: hypothetical protein A2176_10295 [Spirochaetes bacterium RBG_13_51_14]
MKARGLLPVIIAALCTAAGVAITLDFNGKYRKNPSLNDPWCGKSIEITKIRFNKYRIVWELITGEKTVVELVGKVEGDMIDFRKAKGKELYGYTYALIENKNKLVVTLTVPDKSIVCRFTRVRDRK